MASLERYLYKSRSRRDAAFLKKFYRLSIKHAVRENFLRFVTCLLSLFHVQQGKLAWNFEFVGASNNISSKPTLYCPFACC
jgi:hypothetical protein